MGTAGPSEENETSLERKLKYFYSPYNIGNDFNSFMKFDAEEADRQLLKHSTQQADRHDQWRKLSKIIFKEDAKVFKRILKTIKRRGFKKPTFRSPHKVHANPSSKKFKDEIFAFCEGRTKEANSGDQTSKGMWSPTGTMSGSNKHSTNDQSPQGLNDESSQVEFTDYFNKLKNIIGKKKENKRDFQRRTGKRRTKIVISRLTSEASLDNEEMEKKYFSSKNTNMKPLEYVEELRSEHEDFVSINENSEDFNFLLIKLPTVDQWKDAPKRITRRRLNATIFKSPECKPTTNIKRGELTIKTKKHPINKRRHLSPNEKLAFAYTPILVSRKLNLKKLSSKLTSPSNRSSLNPRTKPSSNTLLTSTRPSFPSRPTASP